MNGKEILKNNFDRLLRQESNESVYCGIVKGDTGLAICCAYFYEIYHDEEYLNRMHFLLDSSIGTIKNDFTLGYGLAGLCWAVHVVNKKNILEDAGLWLEEASHTLEREFYYQISIQNFDYFNGASGILFYFIQTDNKKIEEYIDSFSYALEIKLSHDIFWETSPNPGKKDKIVNLGVPHGITGLLLLLLLVKERNISNVNALVQKLTTILLTYKYDINDPCNFPSYVYQDSTKVKSSLRWCYGDLSVAYALYKTALIYDNKEMKDLALSILYQLPLRKDAVVEGLSLCHGYISISILYKKIAILLKDNYFQTMSTSWNESSIKTFNKNYNLISNNRDDYFDNPSLLLGYPSYFLHQLSLNYNIDDEWANCLLL